ncbi:hypothetical protein ABXN37_19870 [Piscinibacter sakaiensis]|uniref:Putative phage TerL n=1 Tax=Piscinibacter sakaiensis TaxID=1547922 RepID=A0A0K8P434_PISS1|nr:hypothetical protein [Piscinibacter sakaiensis]GAP37382.1 putative phage TerL [Piscinibacter sakaiensis]
MIANQVSAQMVRTGSAAPDPSLRPIDDDTPDSHAGQDAAGRGSFNLTRLLRLVSDCEDQPSWRIRSDIAHAYVDGKQFTPEQEAAARAEGLGDVKPTNLVGRVIRSVCGNEAKARTDPVVQADDDDLAEVQDALSHGLKEAQRETKADLAIGQSYFGQVVGGVGWVEVARNRDPMDYPYRVADVPRHEMWWDWASKDLLLRDARWVARKQWKDLDELEAAMPQHRVLLRNASNGWQGFAWDNTIDEQDVALVNHYRDHERWHGYARRAEWFDGARRRVKLYEVWYKVPAWGVFLVLSPTRKVLFNQANQAHVQAVASGTVPIERALTRQVRCALFCGPHRLVDVGTRRRDFPYVPFFAYRDDADKSPYGLVEGMIAPQDGYNRRRLRVEWLLRARQIMADNDALDTKVNSLEDIAAAVMRPDLTVVLNPNRKNTNGFQVSSNLQAQKEQLDMMADDKQLMQDVPGVYGSQLGQAASGVTSGIANSLLIEQGAVAMADLNDNYRHARQGVYERLLDLVIEDHMQPGQRVRVGRGKPRRVVVLNQWDPEAMEMRNGVEDAAVRAGLGEAPSTPAFRMQQQQLVGQIIQAVAQASPQAAAVLVPSFVENTDMPDRRERADDVRRVLGLPTEGDRQAQERLQAQQQEQQAKQQQLADEAARLALEEQAAKVREVQSRAGLNEAKTVEIGHSMGMSELEHQQQRDIAQAEAAAPLSAEEQERIAIEQALAEADATA